MPDFTMCEGTNCPLEKRCRRAQAQATPRTQSYFMIPPYEAEVNVCEFFVDRNAVGRASSTSFKEGSS